MAGMQTYGKRTVKSRPQTRLEDYAQSDSVQSYTTTPGVKGPIKGEDNFQKLVNFGRSVGNMALGVLNRINKRR